MPGTEWESDFEKIAKSLKGISMTASRGADLLRRIDEVDICPTETAQLEGNGAGGGQAGRQRHVALTTGEARTISRR